MAGLSNCEPGGRRFDSRRGAIIVDYAGSRVLAAARYAPSRRNVMAVLTSRSNNPF